MGMSGGRIELSRGRKCGLLATLNSMKLVDSVPSFLYGLKWPDRISTIMMAKLKTSTFASRYVQNNSRLMSKRTHPFALHIFSMAQFFERFSYYGIRSLLILYMVTHLNYSDEKSYIIFGVYATLSYALPVIGGYLADKHIGYYR